MIDALQIVIVFGIFMVLNFIMICLISRKIISSKNNVNRLDKQRKRLDKEKRFIRNLQIFNLLNFLTLPLILIRVYKHLYMSNTLNNNDPSADNYYFLLETIAHFLKSLRFLMPSLFNFMINQLYRKNLAKMISFDK